MMDLAEKMYDAYNESIPKFLEPGEWHIPYRDKISTDIRKWKFLGLDIWGKNMSEYLIKVSTVMCARTSYTSLGNELSEWTYDKYIAKYDKLINVKPVYASPTEHCAQSMNETEYAIGFNPGYSRNFHGFNQYREILGI